jgi:hypothetical protein
MREYGIALVLMVAVLAIPPARADTREQLARTAPIHAILEIVRDAAKPNRVAEPCELRATVRRVFQGTVRVGETLRIAVGCSRTPLPDEPAGYLPDWMDAVDYRYLSAGGLIEGRLAHAPAGSGLPQDELIVPRVLAVPSVSDKPRDVLSPQQTSRSDRPRPPNFPIRDVTLTYRLSGRPGQTFRASYSPGDRPSAMVRVDTLGPDGAREGGTIYTPGTDAAMRVWDNPRRTQSIQVSPNDRAGRLSVNPDAFFTTDGTETIAGISCTRWLIEDLLRRRPPEQACVTDDGVVLGRVDATGTMEALTIQYAPRDRTLFDPMIPPYMKQ